MQVLSRPNIASEYDYPTHASNIARIIAAVYGRNDAQATSCDREARAAVALYLKLTNAPQENLL